MVIPSENLDEGLTYSFSLRVTTALGGFGEARVEVLKSADALPTLKVRHLLKVDIHQCSANSMLSFEPQQQRQRM